MEYRLLGNSGLKVSVISFGNALNSNDKASEQRTIDIIKKAHSLGINFFDTAEIYGFGEAERQLGVAIKALNVPREDLVISTKILRAVQGDTINQVGLSRKHVIEGLNNSLKKLQLDYVDVLFCHRFDFLTPMEEVCRTFDSIIKSGKAHYWGTSEWTSGNIFEAYMVCERFNLIKPIVEQPQYNIFYRDTFENDYGRLFDHYRMGSTVWSPLFNGILTGKYNDGIPEQSRLALNSENPFLKVLIDTYFSPENKEKYSKVLKGIGEIAKQIGCTQAQFAMAWVLKNKDVSTAITGSTKAEQLEEVVGSIQFISKITKEVEDQVNKLTQKQPTPPMDWRQFAPGVPRR